MPDLVAAQQALFARMRDKRRVGWKIGHAIEEIGAMAVGWIPPGTVLPERGTYAPSDDRSLRGETEIAVELAGAVAPDAGDDAVRAAVAGLRVALEIVDVARPPGGARGIIEGNLFHRAVAFGDRLAPLDTPVGPATLTVAGRVHHEDERPPDLISAVREVSRLLAACGESLAPGELILTGSVVHVPVVAGDELRAAIDGLGEVSARIAGG